MSDMQEHWDAVRERAFAFQRAMNASISSRLDAIGTEMLIQLMATVRAEVCAERDAAIRERDESIARSRVATGTQRSVQHLRAQLALDAVRDALRAFRAGLENMARAALEGR